MSYLVEINAKILETKDKDKCLTSRNKLVKANPDLLHQMHQLVLCRRSTPTVANKTPDGGPDTSDVMGVANRPRSSAKGQGSAIEAEADTASRKREAATISDQGP